VLYKEIYMHSPTGMVIRRTKLGEIFCKHKMRCNQETGSLYLVRPPVLHN